MNLSRHILSIVMLAACIAMPLASTASAATGVSYGVAMRDLMAAKGTAAMGSPCAQPGAIKANRDGSGYLACTQGRWLPPANHTYSATFTHDGLPFMPGGFPAVVAYGASGTGNLHDFGYAQCVPGGLQSAVVTIGWYFRVTPLPGNDVELMATATALDPNSPLPKKGCVHGSPHTFAAKWNTVATLKPGQSVELVGSDGFRITLTRGNDLAD